MIGVGKLVSHAKARVGAVATQAMINPYLGFDGLQHRSSDRSAEELLAAVIEPTPAGTTASAG